MVTHRLIVRRSTRDNWVQLPWRDGAERRGWVRGRDDPRMVARSRVPITGVVSPASEPPRGHRTVREQVLCAHRD
ncbi:hypothetical protein GCM10027057_13070 [Marisediminicola antarctica]